MYKKGNDYLSHYLKYFVKNWGHIQVCVDRWNGQDPKILGIFYKTNDLCFGKDTAWYRDTIIAICNDTDNGHCHNVQDRLEQVEAV